VDLRRARIGEWLTGAFAVALLVATFLPWYACGRAAAGADGACGPDLTATGWSAFGGTDVVLALAALVGLLALALTVAQRTPALPLAVTSVEVVVAGVAAVLAVLALLLAPESVGEGGAAGARLIGAWLGAGAAVGLLASALAAIRDERVPVTGGGDGGNSPEPRMLTLPSSSRASATAPSHTPPDPGEAT
jgi:hypothetical protein